MRLYSLTNSWKSSSKSTDPLAFGLATLTDPYAFSIGKANRSISFKVNIANLS